MAVDQTCAADVEVALQADEVAVDADLHGGTLTARPDAVIHLESGDDVVVLEGVIATMDRALLPEFVKRYEKKYSFRPSESESAGVFALRPQRVLAWREKDFPTSATRFREE